MPQRKKLEAELSKLMCTGNFAKVLFCLKRKFELWSLYNLSKDGYPKIKMGYMPFLMNIGVEGTTNKKLAAKLNVTKQAMSKTLKELQGLHLIELKPNPADARSSLIVLTLYGMQVAVHARKKVDLLSEKYIEMMGKKKYEDMLASMNMLIDIHVLFEQEATYPKHVEDDL